MDETNEVKRTRSAEATLTKRAELEAILFYYGEPLEVKKIAKLLSMKPDACEELVGMFEKNLLENSDRGLTLLRGSSTVQLVTKSGLKSLGQMLIKEEFREQLTPAGLETLSLIAYLGPVQRSTIDYIRGVNSSFTFRNLLMRGLIERRPNPEKKHIYIYEASFDFLKHMGLKSVEELPEYEKYSAILKNFEAQQTEEQQSTPENTSPAEQVETTEHSETA